MLKKSLRLAVIITIAAGLCCMGMGRRLKDEKVYCPKCKKMVTMHRVPGPSRRRHRHVRYICPKCRKEWTGAPDEAAKEELVCPKCGSTLKECPGCHKKPLN